MTNDEIKNKVLCYVPSATVRTQEDDVLEYMEKKFPGVKVVMENSYVNFFVGQEVLWNDLILLMGSLRGKNLSVTSPCADCGCGRFNYCVTL